MLKVVKLVNKNIGIALLVLQLNLRLKWNMKCSLNGQNTRGMHVINLFNDMVLLFIKTPAKIQKRLARFSYDETIEKFSFVSRTFHFYSAVESNQFILSHRQWIVFGSHSKWTNLTHSQWLANGICCDEFWDRFLYRLQNWSLQFRRIFQQMQSVDEIVSGCLQKYETGNTVVWCESKR